MFQKLRPLKSNAERRNLRKKQNFFELDVIPLEFEGEVSKDVLFESMKTGVN